MARDHLIRAVARQAGVRVACTVSTGVVADGARRHGLTPAATCAVGKALTSGLLLATMTKGGERVTVQLLGDGPIGSITVDATDGGDVRGYAGRPDAGAHLDAPRSTAPLIGQRGVLNVLRDLGLRELYQGQIALTTGEVDEDVEAYLRTSEQVPSALGCEVVLDGPRVVAAGGLLVQSLPGGDPETVRPVQQLLRTGRLRELLAQGVADARELAARLVPEELEVIGDERHVRFQCRCSAERIGDMLKMLGTVDLDEMIADDKPAEIICNFCSARYEVGRAELELLRAQIAGRRQKN